MIFQYYLSPFENITDSRSWNNNDKKKCVQNILLIYRVISDTMYL